MTSRALSAVGRVWHVFAILYVLIFFVVWVSRPGDELTYMLAANGKSLAAVLVGFLIVTAVSRAITGGLRVPQEIGERLPLVESRLNAIIPTILRAVRVVAFLLVVARSAERRVG